MRSASQSAALLEISIGLYGYREGEISASQNSNYTHQDLLVPSIYSLSVAFGFLGT